MTDKIGLFYGSSTCYTEIAAERIRDEIHRQLGVDGMVEVHNIAEIPVARMTDYTALILGIPTWDYGELQEDWEAVWDELDALDLTGTTVALYGMGDQMGYPEWFQDALGYLWAKVVNQGARVIGQWPAAGYQFEQSQALTADGTAFVGLALDEETEFELSDQRIADWCRQILAEPGFRAC